MGFLYIFKLQASETLRNSTHSSTAADLLQAKQQILTHQQQLEEQDHLLEDYHRKKEDLKLQISSLQERIRAYEAVCLFCGGRPVYRSLTVSCGVFLSKRVSFCSTRESQSLIIQKSSLSMKNSLFLSNWESSSNRY